jgi:hypothetical protein
MCVQGKIVQFHRLRREGRAKSINEKIRHARNFKNPYMLNWLVSHCGISSASLSLSLSLCVCVCVCVCVRARSRARVKFDTAH